MTITPIHQDTGQPPNTIKLPGTHFTTQYFVTGYTPRLICCFSFQHIQPMLTKLWSFQPCVLTPSPYSSSHSHLTGQFRVSLQLYQSIFPLLLLDVHELSTTATSRHFYCLTTPSVPCFIKHIIAAFDFYKYYSNYLILIPTMEAPSTPVGKDTTMPRRQALIPPTGPWIQATTARSGATIMMTT